MKISKLVDVFSSILYSFLYSILLLSSSHRIDWFDLYTIANLCLVLLCPITALTNNKVFPFKLLIIFNVIIIVYLIIVSYQNSDWLGVKTLSTIVLIKAFRWLMDNCFND